MAVRPLQPLLFRHTALCMAAAGAAIGLHPGLGLAVCGLILAADSRAWRPLPLMILLACAAAGWGWTLLRVPASSALADAARVAGLGPVEITGRLAAVRGLPDRRLRLLLDEVRAVPDSARAVTPCGRVAWTWEEPDRRPLVGERATFRARLRPVAGLRNVGGPDFSLYQQRQGVTLRAWSRGSRRSPPRFSGAARLSDQWRETLRARLSAALERLHASEASSAASAAHGRGALPALLFGDRFALASADLERLNHAGLSHSLALSGQHLAVAGLAGALGAALLGRLRPALLLVVPRFKLLALASLPPAALYLWLGGAPASLIRAGLMLGIWTLLYCRNSPAAGLDTLLATLLCLIAAQPLALTDPGLLLSCGAVAGILLFAAPLTRTDFNSPPPPRDPARRMGRALRALLLCSLAVQMATLPLVLHLFGRVSPWFGLNLIWLPVLGLWVLPAAFVGLGCLAAGMNGIADLCLWAAAWPCDLLLRGLRSLEAAGWLDSLWALRPHWTAFPGYAALLAAAALQVGRRGVIPPARRLAVAGAGLLLIGPLLRVADGMDETIRLRVLDVGQAQAVLLEWPGGGRALVDGGGFASPRFDSGRDVILPVLTANRPPRLNLVALSHPDVDHLRGLLHLARHVRTERAALAAGLPPKALRGEAAVWLQRLRRRGVPVRELRAGDRLVLRRDLALEAVAPEPGAVLRRNEGLVLRLTGHGRGLVLLPGDLEAPALRRLLRRGRDIRADVLLAPHHGAAGSLTPGFYEAVRPREVLVSCGADNRYGFPAPEVRQALARLGIPLRSTAEAGELRVCWDGSGRIVPERRGAETEPPDSGESPAVGGVRRLRQKAPEGGDVRITSCPWD